LVLNGASFSSGYLTTGAGIPNGLGRVKNFLVSTAYILALGPIQPPIQWASEALSAEVKRPEREAVYLPPANAEVKKTWIYTSTPPYVFMTYSFQCRGSMASDGRMIDE
jgi:hypothetical protein